VQLPRRRVPGRGVHPGKGGCLSSQEKETCHTGLNQVVAQLWNVPHDSCVDTWSPVPRCGFGEVMGSDLGDGLVHRGAIAS
jgi:hypothetical protein